MQTAELPQRLAHAFAEGVVTTYWESYRHTMQHVAMRNQHALVVVANGLLTRMQQRNCTAYEACSQVLPTLETTLSRRLAMAAAVHIVLNDIPAGHSIITLEPYTA